MSEDTDI